jgi:hypothetical protein
MNTFTTRMELEVTIQFHVDPGFPATREEPECPAECIIESVQVEGCKIPSIHWGHLEDEFRDKCEEHLRNNPPDDPGQELEPNIDVDPVYLSDREETSAADAYFQGRIDRQER